MHVEQVHVIYVIGRVCMCACVCMYDTTGKSYRPVRSRSEFGCCYNCVLVYEMYKMNTCGTTHACY